MAAINENGFWKHIESEANEVKTTFQQTYQGNFRLSFIFLQEAAEEEEEAAEGRPLFCSLSPEIGPCNFIRKRFFFNATSNQCERFNYGGCDGNENRFAELENCNKICNKKPKASQIPTKSNSFREGVDIKKNAIHMTSTPRK